jgi:cytoskeletal protein RodZ
MSPRDLTISIVAVVVGAAAVIVAIVVFGSDSKKTPVASPSSAATTSAPSTSPPSGLSSQATSGSAAASVSCKDIANASILKGKLTLHASSAKPTGVPLPTQAPTLICSGVTQVNETAKVTALAWDDATLASYLGQMTDQGWTDNHATPPFHVLDKQGAKYEIVAFTVHGDLVAIFGHS